MSKNKSKIIKISSKVKLNASIIATIKSKFGGKLDIKEVIDPTLVGGIVIQSGGMLFDGSIKTQLELLRDELYKLKSYDKHN